MHLYEVLATLVFITVLLHTTFGEGSYYLKAAKNVPRIGRSNTKSSNIDEMGKFFMKASKSVPRIGRRNENLDFGNAVEKRDHAPLAWSDIAEKFEYDPELFASPEILEQLEMGDDPSAYDWEQIRTKRDNHKKHPKFHFMK